MFTDRTDAGEQLAAELRRLDLDADIVLGIPRGGLPIARPVADALDVPLDVVVASKVGAPGNPELAVAAVADDGTTWRNDSLIGSLDLPMGYLEDETEHEQRAAREKRQRYRDGRPPLDLAGEDVLIVDDGLATGATMFACVQRVRAAGAASVVAAVPVGSPRTAEELDRMVDRLVVLATPQRFSAVGQFYRDFSQVTDEQAMALLD
ncbi:phosphoribosyltransferase [Haloarcula sp. S1CR25-12]|uniref:Phosphoribosyltransferase n=1 Tax=Haloarcula saliterrae TaxID=2950534 RepID=A0ABU2F820_9EURY|nr:phosphoribosyltransferase family protein [Haloarcula sp. S1CR25-12]MDS0257995.1 phosphoribosyltransferase [Haloarcula sp. S1CR25-12]